MYTNSSSLYSNLGFKFRNKLNGINKTQKRFEIVQLLI